MVGRVQDANLVLLARNQTLIVQVVRRSGGTGWKHNLADDTIDHCACLNLASYALVHCQRLPPLGLTRNGAMASNHSRQPPTTHASKHSH